MRGSLVPEPRDFILHAWWSELWEHLKEWLSFPPEPVPVPVPAPPRRRRR